MSRPLVGGVVLLLALPVSAQSAADEPGYVAVLSAITVPAVVFDLLVAGGLFRDGFARKGSAINAVSFGGVAFTIGAILALTFVGDTRVKGIWTSLAAGASIIGLGSGVLGIWGMLHGPPPEPTPPPLVPAVVVSPSGTPTFGLSGAL